MGGCGLNVSFGRKVSPDELILRDEIRSYLGELVYSFNAADHDRFLRIKNVNFESLGYLSATVEVLFILETRGNHSQSVIQDTGEFIKRSGRWTVVRWLNKSPLSEPQPALEIKTSP